MDLAADAHTETERPVTIEVRDLLVRYGDRVVLDGINLSIREGENFVILGGSGSGKSTLLRNMVGLMRPDAGSVLINGEDITSLDETELAAVRKKIGISFQSSALLNSLTVGDNIALPLRELTDLEESTIDIMVKIKLELVGLSGFQDFLPAELSGGMKKRAGVARAMAMDPEIIFYDEPSAGLDPIVAAGMDDLIKKLQKTFNLTSVVVTHELASVENIADRICMLHHGKIVEQGTLAEMKASENEFVRQFFDRRPSEERVNVEEFFRSLTEGGD